MRSTVPPLRDAWLARHVPGGYAGGPMAGDRVAMHLMLRDTSQKRAAVAALQSLWPHDDPSRDWRFKVDSFVAIAAYWDLAELYDWQQAIVRYLLDGNARIINGWAIDARRNRLLITIESDSDLPAVLSRLDSLSLPCRLVAIEVVGPIRVTTNPPPNKALQQPPQTR